MDGISVSDIVLHFFEKNMPGSTECLAYNQVER